MGSPIPNDALYRLVRGNVRQVLAERPDAGDLVVPACPEWRVRDLVAHLLDISEQAVGLLSGRVTGSVQVRDLASGDVPELLSRWDECGAELDRMDAGKDPRSDMLVHDAFSHELDLRIAVGAPLPDGHPGYESMPDVAIRGFFTRLRELGLPAMRLEAPGRVWTSNAGEVPAAVLAAGHHDLYRSLTGRRTHEQITALPWTGDPEPWLPAFTRGPFRPPERPVEELLAVR